MPKFGKSCRQAPLQVARGGPESQWQPPRARATADDAPRPMRVDLSSRPVPTLRRYNDRVARVVKLVDTADLKSADAETRRAGSSPAPGTP